MSERCSVRTLYVANRVRVKYSFMLMTASSHPEETQATAVARARRSTRDRPAKPALSEEAIVDAALAITQAEGLDAVTMRRIASELDTGAASLYVYVANRSELLQAMIDRVMGTVPLFTPDPSRWREQVYQMMRAVRDALESHPGLSAALHEPQATDNVLAGAENIFGILLAGGIASKDAAWGCDILLLITTASAAEADTRRASGYHTEDDKRTAVARMHATFTSLPPERFPLLVSHADELLSGFGDERFPLLDRHLPGRPGRPRGPFGPLSRRQFAKTAATRSS